MKMLFLLLGHLLLIIASAQQTEKTHDYYLAKSKSQETVGSILVGAGVVLIFTSVIVANSDETDGFLPEHFGTSVSLLAGGLAVSIAGIPFLVSGKKNARKAAAIGVTSQKILLPQVNGMNLKLQPAVVLQIGF